MLIQIDRWISSSFKKASWLSYIFTRISSPTLSFIFAPFTTSPIFYFISASSTIFPAPPLTSASSTIFSAPPLISRPSTIFLVFLLSPRTSPALSTSDSEFFQISMNTIIDLDNETVVRAAGRLLRLKIPTIIRDRIWQLYISKPYILSPERRTTGKIRIPSRKTKINTIKRITKT